MKTAWKFKSVNSHFIQKISHSSTGHRLFLKKKNLIELKDSLMLNKYKFLFETFMQGKRKDVDKNEAK